jgi:[acyl-carrier-protein] S-malonyltransferase
MLSSWLELDGVGDAAAAMSDRAHLDLVRLGTTAEADEIKDTAVTQPLVVAAALLAAQHLDIPAGAVIAGHSVGELAAASLAGVLPALDAVDLAAVRGTAMSAACALTPTGMSALMGGDTDTVLATLAELDLVGANVNGGGQIVAAGPLDALAQLAANPPSGVRVIPLPVAGAFHTSFMAPAVAALKDAVATVTPHDPQITLWTNRDGSVVSDGHQALSYLVDQVSSPVRWDKCMASFADHGITGLIELAPAGALTGLAKRGLRGVPIVAVKTPEDLDAAVALLNGEAA